MYTEKMITLKILGGSGESTKLSRMRDAPTG
jgi:hypothetical protein